MSSHRKPRLSFVRNRARALTLCAATFGTAALPGIASAATGGTATATVPQASRAHTPSVHAVAVSDHTHRSGSSSSSATTTHTVVAGDTLFGIAKAALGNGEDYPKLYQLNKGKTQPDGGQLTDPDLILVGWKIQVPSGSSSASSGSSSTDDSSSSSSSSSASSSSSSSSSTSSSSSSSSSYADNLDGWINQAISILSAHGYSVTYNAIYQTAMNESSGNPSAENGWDSNAAAGTPSIGLMQVIQPTFDAYALSGYNDIWNPVDNIIAAVIYAQDTYGGLDNVVADRCGGSCWYGY